jgi:hypothetical protein
VGLGAAAIQVSKNNPTASNRNRNIVEPQVNPANGIRRIHQAIARPSVPDEWSVLANRCGHDDFSEMDTCGSFRRVVKRQHVLAAGDAIRQHGSGFASRVMQPPAANKNLRPLAVCRRFS